MRYALLMYCGEDTAACGGTMSREPQITALLHRLRARGVLADSLRLLPAHAARVVRCWDGGDILVSDGPATHTREHLTGWVIAECKDLGTAVQLATTIPAAWYGSVEVRPVGQALT